MIINIGSRAEWPASLLSNFAATPFEIDGVACASAEGFIQGLKYEDIEKQIQVCSLSGSKAKFAGKKRGKQIKKSGCVWWKGQEIEFRSPEHFALIERALRAKFSLSEEARTALLATGETPLTHDLGRLESPHTSLPAIKFIRMLESIRKSLQNDSL